jgi:hypothetical protein
MKKSQNMQICMKKVCFGSAKLLTLVGWLVKGATNVVGHASLQEKKRVK